MTQFNNTIQLTTGLKVTSKAPIDDRMQFATLTALKEYLSNGNINRHTNASNFYKGLSVYVAENGKRYQWSELTAGALESFVSVTDTYIYPSAPVNSYAGKSYGFVEIDKMFYKTVTVTPTSAGLLQNFRDATEVVNSITVPLSIHKSPNEIVLVSYGRNLYIYKNTTHKQSSQATTLNDFFLVVPGEEIFNNIPVYAIKGPITDLTALDPVQFFGYQFIVEHLDPPTDLSQHNNVYVSNGVDWTPVVDTLSVSSELANNFSIATPALNTVNYYEGMGIAHSIADPGSYNGFTIKFAGFNDGGITSFLDTPVIEYNSILNTPDINVVVNPGTETFDFSSILYEFTIKLKKISL
jgi:hypothetical protein